ncbi:MAG: glycosyltransferase family 4 protein, partial [bacterium]|nr:glycosyltransferase family 4 protein [bacterium]
DSAHIARIMAHMMQCPYTLTTHATDIFVPRNRERLLRVLHDASKVFTISEYNLTCLADFDLPRDNIVVARLGLDTTKLPKRKFTSGAAEIVCTASGLVPKKGVPVLVEAMRLLKEHNIECCLTVIGSDPEGTKLQEFRKNSEDLPINFAGVLSSEETLEVLAGASLFVLPCIEAENGDKDGIPVALMEAMGMNLPCISTRVSGIPELIENNVSGILVNPGSPSELAEAMASLLTSSLKAEKLAKAGKDKVLSIHSPERLAQTRTTVLTEALKERNTAGLKL